MAQTPCKYRQLGDTIDYNPGSAVLAGTVYLLGSNMVTIVPKDIAADEMGATCVRGVFNVPKDNSNVSAGDDLYWNATGDPYGGTAGSGAFTTTSGSNVFAGIALEAAGTTTGDVDMVLQGIDGARHQSLGYMPSATVAAGGTTQANANAVTTGFTKVTGADNTASIVLPSAAAGAVCVIKSSVSGKTLPVFPAASDAINGGAANASYIMANMAQRVFVAYDATTWYTDETNPT